MLPARFLTQAEDFLKFSSVKKSSGAASGASAIVMPLDPPGGRRLLRIQTPAILLWDL
jgi:hypothetical protein